MCKGSFLTLTWLRTDVLRLKFIATLVGVGWLILALVTLPVLASATSDEPVPPLRAWTIAADGAVFVLDADNIVHQLDPIGLASLAQSSPLSLGVISRRTPAHLLADENYLFVGSQAVSQTLVFSRDDFQPVTTLRHAGPMALDPGKHLFMISAQTHQLLAYNPVDLSQLPQGIEVGCIPVDMAADPAGRRLYVRLITSCGSSHHAEGYSVYDLDALAAAHSVGRGSYGFVMRPAVIEGAGLGAGVNLPYSGYPELFTFDGQGRILSQKPLPYPHDAVALAAYGDRLYLHLGRGLAVMRVGDLSVQSFLPFTETVVPADLALSPNGETVYLFGEQVTAHSTSELQKLGLSSVSPFPLAWLQGPITAPPTLARVYPSPDVAQEGVVFAQLLPVSNPYLAEVYRSNDNGHSWGAFPVLAGGGMALSLSPDFATDRTLVNGSLRSTDGGETWASWSPLLAFVSDRAGNREIYAAPEFGDTLQRLTDDPSADENPAWSPAWTRLAFQSDRTGNWDIFSLRADCTPAQAECDLHQLTDDGADDLLPAWSPDGRRIAFVSTRDGNPEIYLMDKDGKNQRRLTFDPDGDWRPAWLSDSQRLLFTSDRHGNNDIYLLTVPPMEAAPPTTEPILTPVVTGPADDRDPAIGFSSELAFSFDVDSQEFLFFLSDRDGTMKTYATLADGSTTVVKQFPPADQTEAHPSWFNNTLLAAMGEAEESDIYKLTSYGSPQAIISSPGFDGQPAGGPVWWQPDEADSLAWLTNRSSAAPTITPGKLVIPTQAATPTPMPQPAATPTATPTPPTLTTTASITIPNLTPIGHLGGRMNAVFAHDGYAYLGMGPELVVLDVTNPAQPTRVGAMLLPKEIYDVEVAGHLAYVLAGGLYIVDVSDPATPKEIGFYQTPDYTSGLTVVNNKVYLAPQKGLLILDVADPTTPVELGFCALTQVVSRDVAVWGDKAYVATASTMSGIGGLSLVDISDPTRPGEISRLQLGGSSTALGVGLRENWVYIAGGSVPIINVTDPTQPIQSNEVIKHPDQQESAVTGLAVVDHYLYLADSRSGLRIADITDPIHPVEVSFIPLRQWVNNVAVADNYAYVVSGVGLQIFDVTNPATPTQVAQYLAPTGALGQMAGQGHYLYLASSDSLNVIDVSQPASPVQVSSYYLPQNIRRVTTQGQYLYLATESPESGYQGKIQIFDISNPISLTEVSSYELPGRALNLAVAGNYVYVDSGGLLVLDISNPAVPREVAYEDSLPGTIAAIAGNYAYALGGYSGLHVLDISHPAAPVEVAVQPVKDQAWAAALAGHYLYLGERTFGFHVLDIADPTVPIEVNAIEDLGGKHLFGVEDMVVGGDRLYLTTGADGLRVFDISNRTQPVETGTFNLPSSSFSDDVVVGNGAIYVSNRSDGLYILPAPR